MNTQDNTHFHPSCLPYPRPKPTEPDVYRPIDPTNIPMT